MSECFLFIIIEVSVARTTPIRGAFYIYPNPIFLRMLNSNQNFDGFLKTPMEVSILVMKIWLRTGVLIGIYLRFLPEKVVGRGAFARFARFQCF